MKVNTVDKNGAYTDFGFALYLRLYSELKRTMLVDLTYPNRAFDKSYRTDVPFRLDELFQHQDQFLRLQTIAHRMLYFDHNIGTH